MPRKAARNAGRAPDQSFIRFEGEEFTFGEMGRASGQVAETLVEAGVGYQSRVALAIGNRPAFLAAFLGILRCGATAIPLN
ncbi:MAG: AMP-binding protein, partial [Gammaproteobacteria bacterium]